MSAHPFQEIFDKQNQLEDMIRQILNRPSSLSAEQEAPIDIEEAAKILNLQPDTIQRNTHRIPHRLIHRKLYFFRSELITYIDSAPGTKLIDGLTKAKRAASQT